MSACNATARSAAAPLIALNRVSRSYGHGDSEVHALVDATLAIFPGEFVAIMGSSGSGKSTCLNLLGCLDQPSAGQYFYRGVDVALLNADQLALLRRHYIGFVFQGFHLMARASALENVELPLIYRRVGRAERRRRALAALTEVGLAERATHSPAELSGGQQQRVAIARAMVTEPELLLADEPTGNLDSSRKDEIMQLLAELNRRKGVTVVMVTHEPEMAAYARRTLHFGDGRLQRDSGFY